MSNQFTSKERGCPFKKKRAYRVLNFIFTYRDGHNI